MGRANSVKYGDVTIISESETMEDLIEHVKTLVRDLGYPGKDKSDADELKAFEKSLAEAKPDPTSKPSGIAEAEDELIAEESPKDDYSQI